MNVHLAKFIGKQVDVWTISESTEVKDSGLLHDVDETWLVLKKNEGLLFFALRRVRLVKPQV